MKMKLSSRNDYSECSSRSNMDLVEAASELKKAKILIIIKLNIRRLSKPQR